MPCFLLFVFHLAPLFPQQNMGMQCSPWERGIREEGCALHRKGRGWDFLVCYRYASLVTSSFPTIYSSYILIMRLGKLVISQIWMHTPAKSFIHCQDKSLFLLCPRKPEPKVSKKDWVCQQVPLSARDMVPFSRILSSCSLLLAIRFASFQVFILIHFLLLSFFFLVTPSFASYNFSCPIFPLFE